MTRGSLLGWEPSGTRSVLAWTVCGAWGVHSASACCVLCVEAELNTQRGQPGHHARNIVASPGTMLAPALSTDREQQQQYIPTPASAKDALAQHHAHHCSVCGAARHTHRHTHMCAHTHTLTRMRMRMRTHIQI